MAEAKSTKHSNKRLLPIILSGAVLLGCLIYGIVLFHDYSMLTNSTLYTDGPIGFAPKIPPTDHAYQRLMASPFAVPLIKAMEEHGTNEGKLFALKALKALDSDYFSSLAAKYQGSSEKADCQYFDMVGSEYLRSVFEPLDNDSNFAGAD